MQYGWCLHYPAGLLVQGRDPKSLAIGHVLYNHFLSEKSGGAPFGDYTLVLALFNSCSPIKVVVPFLLYNFTVR